LGLLSNNQAANLCSCTEPTYVDPLYLYSPRMYSTR
jgi:hypothetical protein